MIKDEKIDFISSAYRTLKVRGVVKTQGDFAKLLDISQSSLSSAKNGDTRYLTENLLIKIQQTLDYYTTPITDEEIERDLIPIVPTDARAGSLSDFSDSYADYHCERMISPIRGADMAIQITGDSMSPEYPSGSLIVCKRINEEAFIEWGKVFVLDTPNGAVIKSVRKTDKEGVIECVSLNPAYQPFTIETKYIKRWYRVLMVCALK